jgi:hypothetical protein
MLTDTFTGSATYQAVRAASSTSTGGSFTIYGMPNGTWYLAMFYNAEGNGTAPIGGNGNNSGVHPNVGDSAKFYNITGCNPAGATGITTSGATNNLGTVTFDNTQIMWGFTGAVTYKGSAGGAVNNCTPIIVEYYPTSSYTSGNDATAIATNGGHFDTVTFGGGAPCGSASFYVQAWVALDGNTGSPGSNPQTQLGSQPNTNSQASPLNITIN